MGGSSQRSLITFCVLVGFGEGALYSVLAPILPDLTEELSLSASGAGVLTAAYPAGIAVATIPAGMAVPRIGARRTCSVGLVFLVLACAAFGLVESEIGINLARFFQGVGSCTAWAGALAWLAMSFSAKDRAAKMGVTFSAAFTGVLLGPVIGAAAAHVGRSGMFLGMSLVLLLVLMWGGPRHAGAAATPSVGPSRGILRHPPMRSALAGMILLGILTGGLNTLGPLVLAERGLDATGIAICFLAATGPQIVITPLLGRKLTPVRALYVIVTGFAVEAMTVWLFDLTEARIVAAVLFSISVAIGMALINPLMFRVSVFTDRFALPHGMTMALANGGWGVGATVGGVAFAQIAELHSFGIGLTAMSIACLVSIAVIMVGHGSVKHLAVSGDV